MRAGPWVQEPEFDIDVRWTSANRWDLLEGLYGITMQPLPESSFSTTQPGSFPLEPYQRLPSMLSTELSKKTVHDGEVWMQWASGGFTEDWEYVAESRVRASISALPLAPGWSSSNAVGITPFYYWPGDAEGTYIEMPEGATGIEFEGHPDGISQWLMVSLLPTTRLEGRTYGSSAAGGGVAGTLHTDMYLGPIRTSNTGDVAYSLTTPAGLVGAGSSGYRLLSEWGITEPIPLDISPYAPQGEYGSLLPDNGGWPALHMWTPGYLDPITTPDGGGGNYNWSYGFGFSDVRLRWRVRPPRYRWVYPGNPYRRTYPRDDGLAGGAPRTWPASKALQSSRRVEGGGGYL